MNGPETKPVLPPAPPQSVIDGEPTPIPEPPVVNQPDDPGGLYIAGQEEGYIPPSEIIVL